MGISVKDGNSGNVAKVYASNKLAVHAVSGSEVLDATERGKGFNLNTGLISFTADGTLMYIKNNESYDLIIESIIVGLFSGITHSTSPYISVVRNPTGGDLISDASALAGNVNRDFGSNITLAATAYKGKTNGTLTGGDTVGPFQITSGGRSTFPVEFILGPGSSIGISLTANISSGSASAYCAVRCYVKDPNLVD